MSDIASDLAKSDRGLIVAPAGCGKTRLIADAVNHDQGRQLILTHTHAGVRAILNHLRKISVPLGRARVTTIDSLALRYATAFPKLSGRDMPDMTCAEWDEVHKAAVQVFQYGSIQKVLRETYRGIYVDEYQDCSVTQHSLITALACVLPCRILGDPLQAIFSQVHGDKFLRWSCVEREFEKIAETSVPYRWRGNNEQLGEWLLDVRHRLEKGEELDFKADCLSWEPDACVAAQIGACKRHLRYQGESVLGVRKWPAQCYKLVGSLENTFRSMETVECADLLKICDAIEDAKSTSRLLVIDKIVKSCLSRIPKDVQLLPLKIHEKRKVRPTKRDRIELLRSMNKVAECSELTEIDNLLACYERLKERPVFRRGELWQELRESLQRSGRQRGKRLREIAWSLRERTRQMGRRVPLKCISTTLLVKGLEFDHSIVLNLEELGDAENVYVALTRGAKSLTILASSDVVRLNKPHYLL